MMHTLARRKIHIHAYAWLLSVALFTGGTKLNGQTAQAAFYAVKNTSSQMVRQLPIKGLNKKADLVLAGKLIPSGRDQLIVCEDSTIYVYNVLRKTAHVLFSVVLEGAIQQVAIGDADSDGHPELVAATGKAGYSDSINIRLFVINKKGDAWQAEAVYTKDSERPHPTFLGVADIDEDGRKEIVLSYFESKYIVETVAVGMDAEGNWRHRVMEKKRMALAKDIGVLPDDRQTAVVVGRPYGDSVGLTGDAYLLRGETRPLPAFRGVKAVKIGDLERDGKNEIFTGDGWHQDYGKIARGRVAMIAYTDTGYHYELIEDVKGQYEVSQLAVGDIDGDGKNELLARGNKSFRVYTRGHDGWKVFSDDAVVPAPFTLGDINGDHHPDVVFAGKDKIAVYNFKDLAYDTHLGKEVITEKVDPASLVGHRAPELTISNWYNGASVNMAGMKGKVVLLDFWATWCRPCVKMFPVLRSWQEKYGPKGLVILGLTKQDDTQDLSKIEAFVEKQQFPYRIGVSDEAFNNLAYGVGGIPHMVLIDKQGIVRRIEVGASDGKELELEILKYLEQ